MLDLVDQIPELKSVTNVVITGGGPSLNKYIDTITKQIQYADTVLFDANGYYSQIARDKIADHQLPKFIFMMDFGLENIQEAEANKQRVKNFSTLKQARLVCHDGLKPKHVWTDVAIRRISAPLNKDPDRWYEGTLHGRMGTLGLALSCIPKAATDVHLYGCDNLLYAVKDNIQTQQQQTSYERFRVQLAPFIAKLSQSKNFHLHG